MKTRDSIESAHLEGPKRGSPLAGAARVKVPAAFTLIELLAVVAVIALVAGILLPALSRAKGAVNSLSCLNNLKDWGLATHLYAVDNDDYMPPEGPPTPGSKLPNSAWYVTLPSLVGAPSYGEMPWRTNPNVKLGSSLFVCPANPRRATNNNLFHYCLNAHIDGTGSEDHMVRLTSLPAPSRIVQLFDNGKRAAVAQQNNVHPNLHRGGAQFLFVDGHARRFGNLDYWDFSLNRGRTNNPQLVWRPGNERGGYNDL